MNYTSPDSQSERHTQTDVIKAYLKAHSDIYQELCVFRQKGWDNPEGDAFFYKQRKNADKSSATAAGKNARYFYKLMRDIGREINTATKALTIEGIHADNSDRPSILDLCMAPGGFLSRALNYNPGSRAVAFSLPVEDGGHDVVLPSEDQARVRISLLDVTMLAADMGVTEIPSEHGDAAKFLRTRQLAPEDCFRLVFCDGQVLRTHARASYREHREARRLVSTQLALGLEHLVPGGTMVVLLHRVEAWDTVLCLQRFSRFATVRLFKPRAGHEKRSSFYLIAKDVQSDHEEAARAVEEWKRGWNVATFAASDKEFGEAVRHGEPSVEEVLEDYGTQLVDLGREVWGVQAKALAKAPFIAGR